MKKQECEGIFGTVQHTPNISSYERTLTKVKRHCISLYRHLIDVGITSCVYWVSTVFHQSVFMKFETVSLQFQTIGLTQAVQRWLIKT